MNIEMIDRRSFKLGAKQTLEALKYLKETKGLSWEDAWTMLYTMISEDSILDFMRELGL